MSRFPDPIRKIHRNETDIECLLAKRERFRRAGIIAALGLMQARRRVRCATTCGWQKGVQTAVAQWFGWHGCRLLLFAGGVFRAAQVEFELGLVARAGNLDGQKGPRSFVLKERVHGFQEKRFDSSLRLRELRLHSQNAAEIELLAAQTVGSLELHGGTPYIERQSRETHAGFLEHKTPPEARRNILRRGFVRLLRASLCALAQCSDLLLRRCAGELDCADSERAVEVQPVGDVLFAGREYESRLEADDTGHWRLPAHRQAHQVFDPAFANGNLECDGLALGSGCAFHPSSRLEAGAQKAGIHWFEIGVSVGAVHDRMELSLKMHCVAANIHSEIWRVGCALDDDVT